MASLPNLPASLRYPEPPELSPALRATAQGWLRYEDVSQDGRVMLNSLAHGLGLTVWQNLLVHHPGSHALNKAGIVPILTRFVIEGGDGPTSVRRPLDMSGGCRFSHTEDATGKADRICLEMWVDVSAPASRTHGAPPANAGTMLRVGRIYAEHVFTRLFAPPDKRKVLSLDGIEGMPSVPPERHTWRMPDELLALPEGATWLEPAPRDDVTTVVFGLTHTDSNQHVNSLVYPRMFEEAALRRFAAIGREKPVLARYSEVAYRKPCFAGERKRISLRAFAVGEKIGVCGAFLPVSSEGGEARPHCTLRMLFA
jgi:hypothetical protein